MSRHILLDAGPLGLLTTPRSTPPVEAIRAWLIERRTAGDIVLVSEVADYEVRRELLRAGKARGVRALDMLAREIGYLPLSRLPCARRQSSGHSFDAKGHRPLLQTRSMTMSSWQPRLRCWLPQVTRLSWRP